MSLLFILIICQLKYIVESKALSPLFADFRSGENDLVPLEKSQQIVALQEPLSRDQLILQNRLLQNAQAVQDDSTTPKPRDPFFEDPSSGQQIQPNGNVTPMLLNERLLAKQSQFRQIATVNELPLIQGLQLPKPIVPEVVVRGSAINDPRLSIRNNLRLCQQPF